MEASSSGILTGLSPSEAAILDNRQVRTDIPCELTPVSPELRFDLGFHAGYEVALPLRALAGEGNTLTAIFRVIPEGAQEEPTYFSQHWAVPHMEHNTRGTAHLRGAFVVGEGDYRVDWLIGDRTEQFCSAFWRFSASRRGKDQPITLWVAPGTVQPEIPHPFMVEAPLRRDAVNPLHVLVLLHVAPQAEGGAAMPSEETLVLSSVLHTMARESHITSYSLRAFNIERNEVLYYQEDTPQIDFRALGAAIEKLQLGTVDVRRLCDKDRGDLPFITEIVREALATHQPDALIFVGPKGRGGDSSVRDSLKRLGVPGFPTFYLSYTGNPNLAYWGDAISSVVKFWKGSEYTIEKPRDLFFAWREVMSRIARKRTNNGNEVVRGTTAWPKNVDQSSYKEHP